MSSRVCTHCGSSDIDTDPTRGDSVCTNCGSVLEDQIIVSEVQFQENAIGGSSAVGQFISSDGIKSHTFGGTFKHGFGRESRTVTFENGRKKIQHLGNQLKLNQHCIDTAFNFFKMAVTKRLTRGRKTAYVIAACLYLVCRTEGTAHMLLDFSDILQVNVYTLGKTYLQLSKELCINIPAIDPCLYVPRFAHKLEFGDKTHEVSMTALRLVQRMKRDWMHTGRRPSGLCGAALLVSARVHEFCRTTKDIIKVVKVCEATIRKRLNEFEDTASGKLTIDEFSRIDLEEEQDPPSFTKGKQKAKLAQLEEQNKLPDIVNEINSLQEKIEKSLEPKKQGGIWASYAKSKKKDDAELAGEFVEKQIIDEALSSEIDSDAEKRICSENFDKIKRSPYSVCKSESDSDAKSRQGPGPTAASLGIRETIEQGLSEVKDADCSDDFGELDLVGIDDEELDRFLLNDNEVKAKTEMWMLANADYLQEQKEKAEKEAREKELNADKPEKKKRKPRKKSTMQASTAKEAIEQMLMEKKMSNKINYEVLQGLNKAPDPVVKFKAKEEIINPISSLFKRPNPCLPRDVKSEEPTSKKLKVEPVHDVVVESGPVQYDTKDELDYEEDDIEEEEEHVSAAQLMGHTEEVPGYGDDQDVYDDDEY